MQLAMSLTSYKNTIHIFKHTVVFFVYFKRQLTLNTGILMKHLWLTNYVGKDFAPLSFEDTSQERGLVFCLQEHKEMNTNV